MRDESSGIDLGALTLGELGDVIAKDAGSSLYFGAVPYVAALRSLTDMSSMYGLDDASTIVYYLLSNLRTYRGETAKAVKAELKARLK